MSERRHGLAPHKEISENVLQIRAIAPPDFHLKGKSMIRFLLNLTEAAEMEVFGRPIALDQSNYEHSFDAAPHILGGKKRPRDENGIIPWRDSWCTVCVYNSTRDERGVQVTITAHSCGQIPEHKFLRYINTSLHPAKMQYGRLSTTIGQTEDYKDYIFEGDEPLKKIINLLGEKPQTKKDKLRLGQELESAVFARKGRNLPFFDSLLIQEEMRRLQKIFGEYEGILERDTAWSIIGTKTPEEALKELKSFPYYKRYDELTDTELQRGLAYDYKTNNICMIGGGWFPISAILYALKTSTHIHIVERNTQRATIARRVIHHLGITDKVSIIKEEAEKVDYSNMDLVILAAMSHPKPQILRRVSETPNPRTIIIRTPLGDSRAFYPGADEHDLLGPIEGKLHHRFRMGVGVQGEQADSDGVFHLTILDSENWQDLP